MPTNKQDGSPATKPSSPALPSPALHRIAKLLARAGVASRREIERMITEGRVAFGGAIVDTPATLLASLEGVTVDGNPIAEAEPARLFLYHKPTGLLTTERDPAGRPTIYDRLPAGLPRVMPVGRLDLNTEGLLLMTTDGGLKRQLELPATGVERAYRARAYGQVSQPQLEELIHGIEIEGVRYGPIDANIERRTGANLWIEMILKEGKNREVRRVLEHLGLQVSRLIRTRYGPFVLGDLPPGQIGEVRRHDVESFSAEPTRRDLPQPARRRSVEPLAPLAPPVDARPKVEPEGRVKRPARARPAAAKKEPRQRADGSVATRAGSARTQRTRAFQSDRRETEAPARTATPRPGARTTSAASPRSTDRPGVARSRTDGDRPDRSRGGRSDAGPAPRSAGPGTERSRSDRPRDDRARDARPRDDRPRTARPGADRPRTDRPGGDRPRTDRPGGDRPRTDRPGGDRPRTDRPGGDRPSRPGGSRPGGSRPGGSKPSGPRPTGPGKPGPKGPRGGR